MIKIRKYIHWGLIITGVIILIVVFFRFKDYILPVLAVIGGALGFIFRKGIPKDPVSEADRRKEEDACQQIETVKQQAETTDGKQQNLEHRINNLIERIKKRRRSRSPRRSTANILILTVFLLAGTVWAANGDLYIPKDYNELKKLYIEADKQVLEALDIIKEQQQQIADLQKQRNEALQAAETLKAVNFDKDKIIADQSARLEYVSHQWGISAGGQAKQGLTLGLSRRNDNFSFGLGLSSQGNIYGNCTFWF